MLCSWHIDDEKEEQVAALIRQRLVPAIVLRMLPFIFLTRFSVRLQLFHLQSDALGKIAGFFIM